MSYASNLNYFPKLTIPTLLCTSDPSVRAYWMHGRVMSLKASFLPMVSPDATYHQEEARILRMPIASRRAAAQVSIEHSNLPTPSTCCGHGSVRRLFRTLKPYQAHFLPGTNTLEYDNFVIYFTLIAWATVAIVGLGSEFVVGTDLVAWIHHSESGFTLWQLAQMVFSLFLIVAFGSDNVFGLPFLAAGLWKFGFPETLTCLLRFYCSETFSLGSFSSLIDGMGTLLHHFSTSLALVGMMTHLFPRNRAITAACVVPIMQHWFVLVKYRHLGLFVILELVLEVWFQWETLSNIGEFEADLGFSATRIGRGCALSMLLAHYFYLTAAAMRLLQPCGHPESRSTDPDDDDTVTIELEEDTITKMYNMSRAMQGQTAAGCSSASSWHRSAAAAGPPTVVAVRNKRPDPLDRSSTSCSA